MCTLDQLNRTKMKFYPCISKNIFGTRCLRCFYEQQHINGQNCQWLHFKSLVLFSKCSVIQNFDDRGHPIPLNSLLLSSVHCILKKTHIPKRKNVLVIFKFTSKTKETKDFPKAVKIMLWFVRGGKWGMYAGCFLRAFLNTLLGCFSCA